MLDATQLAAWMLAELGNTADVLGLTNEGLQSAVNAVARIVPPVNAQFPSTALLDGVARREAWRVAMQSAASRYNYSEAGGSFQAEQVYKHAKELYDVAALEATSLISAASVSGSTARVPYSGAVRVEVGW